ncbi:DTW domain-containing protein [Gaertneriomyces semiglobifer]|nr:DTW domain-containing protein [Gaertneriomyces semiglobifer]
MKRREEAIRVEAFLAASLQEIRTDSKLYIWRPYVDSIFKGSQEECWASFVHRTLHSRVMAESWKHRLSIRNAGEGFCGESSVVRSQMHGSSSMDPFETFKIDRTAPIHSQERFPCPKCSKRQKVYCPRCFVPLGHSPPTVTLPVPVDIYRDPRETEGKSTSAHAKILAGDDVTIKIENIISHTLETSIIDDYANPERVLLLFPSKVRSVGHIPYWNGCDLTGYYCRKVFHFKKFPVTPSTGGSFQYSVIFRLRHCLTLFFRLIVLDGTWKQGRAMANSISKNGLRFRHVRIHERQTLFWRHQPFGESHLSTIEAVYWFFRDYHEAYCSTAYNGSYDNLLFYFKYQWELIQGFYRANPTRTFTQRKLDWGSYIRYDEEEPSRSQGNEAS